ncbi:DUF5522 domain-containing protein [Ferrimicrobium sp.]|uniref:DUF5522 domain-containing protein n=1 Tax=Ferrimicrobium sp. TaxID=2926050 RepID=UPI002612C427|nr:DUF5522 domain-containing protein [Ferrimicrobium sp.]
MEQLWIGSSAVMAGFDDEREQRIRYLPSERRFDYDHPLALLRLKLHRDACDAGLDSYPDPETGDTVLCSSTLLAQGICCNLGCRHCPYVGGRRPLIPGILAE